MLPLTVKDIDIGDRPDPFERGLRLAGGPARMSVGTAAVGLAILGAIPEVPEPYATIIRITTVLLTFGSAAIIKTMTPATRERDTKNLYKTQLRIQEVVTSFWENFAKGEMERCSSLLKELKEKDTSGCKKKFEEEFKGTLAHIEQTLKSAKKQLREQARQTAPQGS